MPMNKPHPEFIRSTEGGMAQPPAIGRHPGRRLGQRYRRNPEERWGAAQRLLEHSSRNYTKAQSAYDTGKRF